MKVCVHNIWVQVRGVSALLALLMLVGLVRAQDRMVDVSTKVAELFDAGQSAHERGELERAIVLYSEALKLDKLFWQAEYQRSQALRVVGRAAEARQGMLRTIELLSEYQSIEEGRQIMRRARLGLAELSRSLGDLNEAEKSYAEVAKMSTVGGALPVGWQVGQAEVLLGLGRLVEAQAAVEAAITTGDKRPATIALQGLILIRQGKMEEGERLLSESLRQDPGNTFALRQRAEIVLSRRDFKAGIADLREVLRLDPGQAGGIKARLAWALAQNKESTEALRLYQEILQDDPTNNAVRQAVAALSIEAGESEEAIKRLDELIKAEPGRADLRAQMGELLIKSQPEKALEQYLYATKIEPNRVSHRIGVGSALVRLRRMAEAIGVLRAALAMNPPDDVAYYAHTNLGTALYELNDFAAAITEFLWILEHQTDEKRIPITLYFLAICHDRTGDYEEALKVYQQFLSRATNVNKLEVDKVNLRLPILQKQIRDGKGKKKK